VSHINFPLDPKKEKNLYIHTHIHTHQMKRNVSHISTRSPKEANRGSLIAQKRSKSLSSLSDVISSLKMTTTTKTTTDNNTEANTRNPFIVTIALNKDLFHEEIIPHIYPRYSDLLALLSTCKTFLTCFNKYRLPAEIQEQYGYSKLVIERLKMTSGKRLHLDFRKMAKRYPAVVKKGIIPNPIEIVRYIHHADILLLRGKYMIRPFVDHYSETCNVSLKSIFIIDVSKGDKEGVPIPLWDLKGYLLYFSPYNDMMMERIGNDDEDIDVNYIYYAHGLKGGTRRLISYLCSPNVKAFILFGTKYPYKTMMYDDTTSLTRNELYSLYKSTDSVKL
jgi:hypothetical protein